MRFDIRYRTVFTYTEPVVESHNELRACPADDACQRLLDHRVSVHPAARVFGYVDYWGTRVDAFGIRKAHVAMEVVAEASVETTPRPLPTAAPRLEALERPEFVDAHIEFLQHDRHTDFGDGVREAARRQRDLAGPDLVGVILAIHRFVGAHLRYERGVTEIATPVVHVRAGGVGVCQDYAHLAVAMCRSLGIPARYVSGYLFADDDASGSDPTSDTVVVQTHAWFEAAVPGWGWLALDPTNAQLVGERHVKIGHGRSYDDVQPQRGVFLGPAESRVEPLVEIRRVDAADTWRGPSTLPGDGTVGRPTGYEVPAAAGPVQRTRTAQQQSQQQQ